MTNQTSTFPADATDPTNAQRELVVSDRERDFIASNDPATVTHDSVRAKLADAMTPGFQAEFDPAEAEAAGAFKEDALSETDAINSTHD